MKIFQTGMIPIIAALCLPGTLSLAADLETKQPPPSLSVKLFSAMDSNSDQKVSKEEYFSFGETYMQERGKPFNRSVAQRNFIALDVNGNGYIEQDDARKQTAETLEDQKTTDPKTIVGVWRYWDEKNYGFITFVFAKDGQADMVNNNVSTRAMAMQHGGSMTYTYDPSSNPASLDIVAIGGSGPATVMRCIVRFLDEDRIKLRMAHGRGHVKRPAEFTAENMGDTLTLKRSKYKPSEMRYF